MRRSMTYTAAIAVVTIVALIALPLAASAGPPSATKATGGVSTADEYLSFNAFDYGSSGDRGNVSWTDYGTELAGTGVWAPRVGDSFDVSFEYLGTWVHEMTIDSITPLSNASLAFTASGEFTTIPTPEWLWEATGTIVGDQISFTINHTLLPDDPYDWSLFVATGTIGSDGTVSGTGMDNYTPDGQAPAPRTMPWTFEADALMEVLAYSAPVICADVDSGAMNATFGYEIPLSSQFMPGLDVVMNVSDGGTPAYGNDTFGYFYGENLALADGTCPSGSPTAYTLMGGNLTVHK